VADIDGGPDIPEDVVAALVIPVSAAMPVLIARIPAVLAAELGRTGARAGTRTELPAGRRGAPSSLLAERILPVLEPVIAGLDTAGAPDLSPYLGQPPGGRAIFVRSSRDGQVVAAAALLNTLRPGTSELVAVLCSRLARHGQMAPLLAVAPRDGTGESAEETIAAEHGAAYLALGVALANAVVAQGPVIPGPLFSPAAATVGLGLSAASALLSRVPMPDAYATALLEKVRADYRLPRGASGNVPVAGHLFALTEGPFPDGTDFAGNGLVIVVPGGVVIRTGRDEGNVHVMVRALGEPPPPRVGSWDEVVDVSWHAARGLASVIGPDAPGGDRLREASPPWPGDYRLRAHATGRDDADETESYLLEVWQAPPAPEVAHKRTDRLGHRLRGEPEPDHRPAPEREYRWIRGTELGMAATVTVVTEADVTEVLTAFGADPESPEPLKDGNGAIAALYTADPWVAVLDARTAVIAVEYNGFQGSNREVLERASVGGRAASMFWNVNGMTCLSFAEDGEVLASYEPFGPLAEDTRPAVAAALEGLDFSDHRDKTEKGLVAVERFAGRGITREDLDRIAGANVAYRIGVAR
jgi:hypothetical protein